MSILGLPLPTTDLVRRIRRVAEHDLQAAGPEPRLGGAWIDTESVADKHGIACREHSVGLVWAEPCFWADPTGQPWIYGTWFVQNLDCPVGGQLLFELEDYRIFPHTSAVMLWLPNLRPPELRCSLKRAVNIGTSEGESYRREHMVTSELAVPDERNPRICLETRMSCRNAVRWFTAGETGKYFWWQRWVALLRPNEYIASKLALAPPLILERFGQRATHHLRELLEVCPELTKCLSLEAVQWPLAPDFIISALKKVGFSQNAARTLLRTVRESVKRNDIVGNLYLPLREVRAEIQSDGGKLTYYLRPEKVTPLAPDMPEMDAPPGFAAQTLRDVLLLGIENLPEADRRDLLLEIAVEMLDAWHSFRSCLPDFLELCQRIVSAEPTG